MSFNRHPILLSTLFFLSSCLSFSHQASANEIDIEKSIMITDTQVLNNLTQEYDFAYQLGEVSVWLNDVYPGKSTRPGSFIRNFMQLAKAEQANYANYEAQYTAGTPMSMGMPVPFSLRMNKIFKWKSANALNALKNTDLDQLKGSPFRLLAIANLADRAGDLDDRGLPPNTWQPRSLGEMHLVYGYVDADYEATHGKAYPETWVISYRVPAITWNRKLKEENADVQFHMDIVNDTTRWKNIMKRWAKFWRELSDMPIDSPEYQAHLSSILSLIAQPENFLNVRSNTQISDDEFEIREYYLNQHKLVLRKPRREPYACVTQTEDFAQMLRNYWREEYQDLDVTTYVTKVQEDLRVDNGLGLRGKGKNGYTIVRTQNLLLASGAPLAGECGEGNGTSPYKMTTAGNALAVAPFAHVDANFEWDVPGVTEAQRHAFAIRTCSGCHSKEGAVDGFHIVPRLADEESAMSAFLTGEGHNTFNKNGVTYEYNELEKRKAWMQAVLDGNAELFDSLKRNDIQPHSGE